MPESEDKIVLKTTLDIGNLTGTYQQAIRIDQLLAMFGETYIQARNIGWETNALDAIFEELRKIVN